ncbi:MAG: DUF2155 domain-containing protein [Paracoccaceae bacterium]
MGKAPIPDRLIRYAAICTAAVGLWAGAASAQTLPGGTVVAPAEEAPALPAPTVYASPLPLARVAPPEQPRLDPAIAGTVGTVIDASEDGSDPDESVTVVTPEGERDVRVVFNNRLQEGDTVTGSGNEAVDGERAKRFRAAPKPRPTPERARPMRALPIAAPRTRLIDGVTLRALDKMTGTTQTHSIAVGQETRIERLRVRLEGCRAPKSGDSHGTIAFLKIWDTKDPDADEVFTGWMFADSPALSALDHPRYDLWVIKCTTSSGEQSAAKE